MAENKKTKQGTTWASLGGLFTIFSMTVIEDKTWGLIAAVAGVAFALYGLFLLQKGKEEQDQTVVEDGNVSRETGNEQRDV